MHVEMTREDGESRHRALRSTMVASVVLGLHSAPGQGRVVRVRVRARVRVRVRV